MKTKLIRLILSVFLVCLIIYPAIAEDTLSFDAYQIENLDGFSWKDEEGWIYEKFIGWDYGTLDIDLYLYIWDSYSSQPLCVIMDSICGSAEQIEFYTTENTYSYALKHSGGSSFLFFGENGEQFFREILALDEVRFKIAYKDFVFTHTMSGEWYETVLKTFAQTVVENNIYSYLTKEDFDIAQNNSPMVVTPRFYSSAKEPQTTDETISFLDVQWRCSPDDFLIKMDQQGLKYDKKMTSEGNIQQVPELYGNSSSSYGSYYLDTIINRSICNNVITRCLELNKKADATNLLSVAGYDVDTITARFYMDNDGTFHCYEAAYSWEDYDWLSSNLSIQSNMRNGNTYEQQYADLVTKLTNVYGKPYSYTFSDNTVTKRYYNYSVWLGENSTAVFLEYNHSVISKSSQHDSITICYGLTDTKGIFDDLQRTFDSSNPAPAPTPLNVNGL